MSTFLADEAEQKNAFLNIGPSVQTSPQHDLYELTNGVRAGIKEVAKSNKELMSIAKLGHFKARVPNADNGEIIANLTLCYRHLEDASMRLGKTLQALDGGASVYDKATTPGIGCD